MKCGLKENKMSQKQLIKQKLLEKGEVDNLWCINNGIWRLSDIILRLRNDGLNIVTEYHPEQTKVCKYRLIPKDRLFII